jgi:hypothetical protein
MVRCGLAIESVPWRPIFEKCPHLREKGGVLTLRTPVWFVLTHIVVGADVPVIIKKGSY